MSAAEEEAVRKAERHRIADLLDKEGNMLASFCTTSYAALDLMAFLLRLDHSDHDRVAGAQDGKAAR